MLSNDSAREFVFVQVARLDIISNLSAAQMRPKATNLRRTYVVINDDLP